MPSMNTEQTGLPNLSAMDEIGVSCYGLYEQRPVHSPGDYLFLPSADWSHCSLWGPPDFVDKLRQPASDVRHHAGPRGVL